MGLVDTGDESVLDDCNNEKISVSRQLDRFMRSILTLGVSLPAISTTDIVSLKKQATSTNLSRLTRLHTFEHTFQSLVHIDGLRRS